MDTQLKRGILEVCVLAELCRGQSYGYRIQKDLAQYVTLSESALYHILKRQEQAGQVQAASVEHEGRLRRMYSITEKGRRNIEICQSSLPYSVRLRCDENLVKLNDALMRQAQVQTGLQPNEDGTCTVRLYLADEAGPLMELKLISPSLAQGQTLTSKFQQSPEAIYHEIMALLVRHSQEESDSSSEQEA